MTNFKTNRLFAVAAGILGVAILLIAGCSRSPLDSAAVIEEPQLLTRSAARISGPQLSSGSFYTEQVISSELGGQLSLFDVTLDVPAGAVPNDTLFSISIPDIEVFFNGFGTNGLVFDVPVTVTMSYRDADLTGIDESTIRIAWYDNTSGTFQSMDCEIDTVAKVVTGQLHHFSAYGLISDWYYRP